MEPEAIDFLEMLRGDLQAALGQADVGRRLEEHILADAAARVGLPIWYAVHGDDDSVGALFRHANQIGREL